MPTATHPWTDIPIRVARSAVLPALAAVLVAASAAPAASPPDIVSYQGVLRDASGSPLAGSHDMTFRFFDDQAAGAEILVDAHLAAGSGAVTVSDGMFTVGLGSGDVADGSGAGTYTSLAAVFRDHGAVWLEVEVGGEVLSPRVAVRAAPFAHNATSLDGKDGSSFVDTTAGAQTKTGAFTADTLRAAGGTVYLSSAPGPRILTGSGFTQIFGDDPADELRLYVSADRGDGAITIRGGGSSGEMELRSGGGIFSFYDTSGGPDDEILRLHAGGRLRLDGPLNTGLATSVPYNSLGSGIPNAAGLDGEEDLYVAGEAEIDGALTLGFAGRLTHDGVNLTAQAGSGDSLNLWAGTGAGNGGLRIVNDSVFFLQSGNGEFSFRDRSGAGDLEIAKLFSDGSLTMTGSLSTGGLNLPPYNQLGSGSSPRAALDNANDLWVTDDLEVGDTAYVNTVHNLPGLLNHLDLESEVGMRFRTNADGNHGIQWFQWYTGGSYSTANRIAILNDVGSLSLGGQLELNYDGPDTTQNLYFYDGGSSSGESLRWNDTANQFELSNVLHGPPSNNFWLKADSNLRVMIDDDNSTSGNLAEWHHDGVFTNANKLAELQEDGDFRIRKTLSQNVAFDVAESFWASEPLTAGDLVRADPDRPGAVLLAAAGDPAVLGVVSGLPGVLLGSAPFDAASLREVWGEPIHARFVEQRAGLEDRLRARMPELGRHAEAVRALEESARALGEQLVAVASAGGQPVAPGSPSPGGEDGSPTDGSANDLSHDALARPREMAPSPEALAARRADLAAEASARRAELADRMESLALELFCEENLVPVALAGRVPVKVDASSGPIAVGDALAPGPVPGVAVKADGSTTAVAVALEPLASGQGAVLGFVTRFEPSGAALAALADGQDELAATLDDRTPDPVTGVQSLAGDLRFVLDRGADDEARLSVHRDGDVDGALGDEVFRVDEGGNVYARGAFRPHAMDLAEFFPLSEPVEPGDVLAIDVERPGFYRRASGAAERAVVGVVSTEPGLLLGGSAQRIAAADPELARVLDEARRLGDRAGESRAWNALEKRFLETHAALALSGTVPVKVDAGYGTIRPGDLLTSSPTPGHAMRTDDPIPGTVIGKALEPLASGTGTVRILVAPPAR